MDERMRFVARLLDEFGRRLPTESASKPAAPCSMPRSATNRAPERLPAPTRRCAKHVVGNSLTVIPNAVANRISRSNPDVKASC